MSFIDAKPTDSKESLLSDITSAAVNQRHAPGLPLRPFAALMIQVANETSETVADLKAHISRLNTENAKLQGWVVALAIAALVSTIVQTAVALYPLVSPAPSAEAKATVAPLSSPQFGTATLPTQQSQPVSAVPASGPSLAPSAGGK